MEENNRSKGSRYEERAAAFLEENGYAIIERNYRCKVGEIDIIARDAQATAFVEVKYRFTSKAGDPAEAVGRNKQQRIFRTAQWYMKEHHLYGGSYRFDVVSILGGDIRLIKNAFGSF